MYDFVRLSGFGRLRGVGHGVKLPGSIIGMLLLTAFLQMGWVKLRWVKGISDFLVSNMGFFFVPPGVALMLYFDVIAAEFWPILRPRWSVRYWF